MYKTFLLVGALTLGSSFSSALPTEAGCGFRIRLQNVLLNPLQTMGKITTLNELAKATAKAYAKAARKEEERRAGALANGGGLDDADVIVPGESQHALRLILNKLEPEEWDAFYSLVGEIRPRDWNVETLASLSHAFRDAAFLLEHVLVSQGVIEEVLASEPGATETDALFKTQLRQKFIERVAQVEPRRRWPIPQNLPPVTASRRPQAWELNTAALLMDFQFRTQPRPGLLEILKAYTDLQEATQLPHHPSLDAYLNHLMVLYGLR